MMRYGVEERIMQTVVFGSTFECSHVIGPISLKDVPVDHAVGEPFCCH